MRILSAGPGNLRGVVGAIALAAMLAASLLPDVGRAESRSTTVINGKTITVVGRTLQSVNSTDRKTVIVVDGRRIVIDGERLEIGKRVHEIGRFTKIEIYARRGKFRVFVDGRRLR